ncbi:Zn-dependent exopeptidase [Mycena alexandri]|uniref:Zn-dependent exopeptidase n=1 Tax=Mycena alexandri TaxID=1745969 RepID=A0AAD6X9Y2_9AGAR|nr:Zn-dependent exopeptidase [Mycena alexandri]
MEKKGPSGGTYIPLPVTEDPVPTPKTTRRRKFLKFAFISLQLLAFHTFVARPAARWYKNSLDVQERPHGPHGHPGRYPRKGHFLWGKEAEKLYLSIPDENSAIESSRLFATHPHLAGSEGDLKTAKDFLNIFQTEFGLESAASEPISRPALPSLKMQPIPSQRPSTLGRGVRPEFIYHSLLRMNSHLVDVYYPVMNTPLDRSLQLLDGDGEIIWEAELEEVADDTDPDAGEHYTDVPTFHGLSAAGDVQGKLIYANYGRKEDYDDLVEKGVNLTGAIVITRYGGIFRGLKVKGAQELGAAGVLIYSDLRDDGPITEANGFAAYPHGPARNVNSVQRGSVQFLSIYPGDPTTPGYPSYENSTRTSGENIPKIPSLPISAANAAQLLALADDGKEVRLVNHVDTKVTPIWNTMAVIPGFITDEVVVVGNHRDAWVDSFFFFHCEPAPDQPKVLGAADPSSGTASINEVIRGLGALSKKGWKPLRTILIASWDAEEYGLIGSTEWVEDFPEFIGNHVVTYLNLDSSVSGSRFGVSASPSLSHFLRQTALDTPHPTDPERETSLDSESLGATQFVTAAADNIGVSPLGSGSDYTAFLQLIGVASSNTGFGGTEGDAVYHYHSIFDSQRWQELYADPGFHRHVAVAKHLGLQLLRLSSDLVLPLNTTHYTYVLEEYLNGIEAIALDSSLDVDLSPLRKSIVALQAASHSLDFEKASAEKDLRRMIHKWKKRQHRLKKKLHRVYCRLKKKIFGKKCHKKFDFEAHGCTKGAEASDMSPHSGVASKFRVGRLPAFLDEQNGLNHEVLSGLAVHGGFHGHLPGKFPLAKFKKAVHRIRTVNKKLVSFEKGFISKDGIPDREWYKHLAIAPGKWLGYGATPLPALAEAIQIEKNATLAQYEVGRLTDLIDKLSNNIRVHA